MTRRTARQKWVCLKIVYPYTQWFCWSLSLLNGYNWGYTPFSDIPTYIKDETRSTMIFISVAFWILLVQDHSGLQNLKLLNWNPLVMKPKTRHPKPFFHPYTKYISTSYTNDVNQCEMPHECYVFCAEDKHQGVWPSQESFGLGSAPGRVANAVQEII